MIESGRAAHVKEHVLFRQFPLQENVVLSVGEVSTPYHIYDSRALMVGGVADWNAVSRMLAAENVVPVRDGDGNALMAIWLCDFTEANLGPHHELQFSFFVSRGEVAPVISSHLGVLTALLTRPDVMMFCSGLWNDTPIAVAYNREMLSLDARLSEGHIRFDAGRMAFDVTDQQTGRKLLAGQSPTPGSTGARIGWRLAREVGFLNLWRFSRKPYSRTPVINPRGKKMAENRIAETYSANNISHFRYFNAEKDQLHWGETPYASLGFQPHFVNWLDGFRLVYMTPTDVI